MNDPIPAQVKAALVAAYGNRLNRVVLYGSRARGDAREDSDYDVAVFLTEMSSAWIEFNRLAAIELEVLNQTGNAVHAMPYRAESLHDTRSPLMHEIRRDGIEL